LTDTGDICIVMEYCESGDLEKKINAQQSVPFPEEQVLIQLIKLARAEEFCYIYEIFLLAFDVYL